MSEWDICQQTFGYFDKAFLLLQEAAGIENPSVVERAGLIHFFEMAFDLSLMLLREYEEAGGVVVNSPREAIKSALEVRIIQHGDDWVDALDGRKVTVATYDNETAVEMEQKIKGRYLPLLRQLHRYFIDSVAQGATPVGHVAGAGHKRR